jgi:hypothetical protein
MFLPAGAKKRIFQRPKKSGSFFILQKEEVIPNRPENKKTVR